jgi:hypothetical protein
MEQDEVQRIVVDPEDPIDPEDPSTTAPGLETTQKRKSRDVKYSQVWEHFIKGPKQADGSYNALSVALKPCCILSVANCLLLVALKPVACCLLPVACCMLLVVCCLLP